MALPITHIKVLMRLGLKRGDKTFLTVLKRAMIDVI